MAFTVGVCEVVLGLPPVTSLKEKRGIIRRVVDRARNRYPISMAEVDELDSLGCSVLGFSVVSNDRRVVNSIIDKVIDFIEDQGLANVEDYQVEILNY